MERRAEVRCTRALLATTAIVGMGAICSERGLAQDLPDVRNIRPVVMLLVDTSGSMERKPVPASGGGCGDCKPVCTGTAADVSQKNRWAVTLESLTGTFDTFRCYQRDRSGAGFTPADFDYGYFLPHYDFFSRSAAETNSTQTEDGLIDAFDGIAKFGLMTFDGVGTTIGGDTLVPLTRWSDSTFLSQANGAPGMYSYGRVGTLSFPGCTDVYGFNAGARAAAPTGIDVPGALISASASDDAADVSRVNTAIQTSLRAVRPFGGTPIAAMLDDLEYYLQNDSSVRSGSDRYYNCRGRYAILLTDGAPDALFRDARFQCQTPGTGTVGAPCAGSGCACPYDTEANIASRIVGHHLLNKLFIVGYNVDDASAFATLDAIAAAGGSTRAMPAASASALRTELQRIMLEARPDASSRSIPVPVQTSIVGGRQFEITSGFRLGATAEDPWYGILNRRRLTCTSGAPVMNGTLEGNDLLHERLNAQTSRNVFTVAPSVRSNARGTIYASYAPEAVLSTESTIITETDIDGSDFGLTQTRNLNRPSMSQLPNTAPTADSAVTEAVSLGQANEASGVAQHAFTDTGADALAPTMFSASGSTSVTSIMNYVLGRTGARASHKLGDIVHSNPVVLNPLAASDVTYLTSDTRYGKWLRDVAGRYDNGGAPGARPGMIFVGTNDGILHGFTLDDPDAGADADHRELWGFVPPALYDKMPAMITPTHQWMFDGTPVVKDVVLHRAAGATSAAFYRTVLLSAVRGAPAFVALDVTFPDRPKVMWQRSFAALGNTVATPALTQANIAWDGIHTEQRAIAILPGGSGVLASSSACGVQSGDLDALAPNTNARTQVRCWQQRGRSLYVVDVASGRLLQEFDARHFPSPLTGAVSVDGLGTSVSRAAYFTDADGQLWRLSMMNPNPAHWVVAPIFDVFYGRAYDAGRVSSSAPTLTRDTKGNLVIAVGTGDLDNLTDTVAHRVVSLTEQRVLRADGEIGDFDRPDSTDNGPKLNWLIQLSTGEAVTGPLTLFEDTLYFGTFASPTGTSGDACQLGLSRLYGAHVRLDDGAGNVPPTPKPELYDAADTVHPYKLSEEVDSSGNSLVLGLAISRQPICVAGTSSTSASTGQSNFVPTGASTGGGFQLRALVGGGNSAAGAKLGGSELRELTRDLRVLNQVNSVGFAGAVE
jgi:type IV pilus assembly protein PilY1